MLVCQAEEQENKDPALSGGTYPVTSLVDWRQARRGGRRRTVGEMWRKVECARREQCGIIKGIKNKKAKTEMGQKKKTEIRN